jgi:hypothetical protein
MLASNHIATKPCIEDEAVRFHSSACITPFPLSVNSQSCWGSIHP